MTAKTRSKTEAFAKTTKLKPAGAQIQLKGSVPGEGIPAGTAINLTVTARDDQHFRLIELKTKLAEGGEGAVFTTSINGYVAKIYKREKITTDRRGKLMTMIIKQIRHEGICFPVALIFNECNEFVGYLMPEAKGYELGKSVFQPKLLHKKFPDWNKVDLIDVSISILKKIKYLNDLNVILGDINPANILVTPQKEVYLVDCDSYQVEGYPCPVGTANFTPPEALGKDYKSFLRTQAMENFAIATLLFMLMMPGKPPYSAVGGASPAQNICEGLFPYPHLSKQEDRTPPGRWGFIWSHMSYKARLAFYENFKKGEKHFLPNNRYSADQWLKVLKDYRFALDKMAKNDELALEIFPGRLKKKKCKNEGCTNWYVPDQNDYSPFCNDCRNEPRWQRQAPKTGTMPPAQPQERTKLCPYCKTSLIDQGSDHCHGCRDVVLTQRECVNCHESFPVTVSLKYREQRTGHQRKQCDVCRSARCTADPCKHAAKPAAAESKIQDHQPAVAATRNQPTVAKSQDSAAASKQPATAESKIQGHQPAVGAAAPAEKQPEQTKANWRSIGVVFMVTIIIVAVAADALVNVFIS